MKKADGADAGLAAETTVLENDGRKAEAKEVESAASVFERRRSAAAVYAFPAAAILFLFAVNFIRAVNGAFRGYGRPDPLEEAAACVFFELLLFPVYKLLLLLYRGMGLVAVLAEETRKIRLKLARKP